MTAPSNYDELVGRNAVMADALDREGKPNAALYLRNANAAIRALERERDAAMVGGEQRLLLRRRGFHGGPRMTALNIQARLVEGQSLHDRLAVSHPSLTRGRVWRRSCGASQRVDSAKALRTGWPKCCSYTMTIDSPVEQAALAKALQDGRDAD